jgi:hypothetical protein
MYYKIGYVRQFRGLQEYLSKQSFADQIEVIGVKDARVTGNFEVRALLVPTGQLLHSKTTMGQGKAESVKERAAIAEQIVDLLAGYDE